MCTVLLNFTRVRSAQQINLYISHQRWSRGHKARGQGHKKPESKDSPSENRPSRGQGQEYSRPRPRTKNTSACVLQKKGFQKFFSGAPQNFNNLKNSAVLEPRTGQFWRTWDFEAMAKNLKTFSRTSTTVSHNMDNSDKYGKTSKNSWLKRLKFFGLQP